MKRVAVFIIKLYLFKLYLEALFILTLFLNQIIKKLLIENEEEDCCNKQGEFEASNRLFDLTENNTNTNDSDVSQNKSTFAERVSIAVQTEQSYPITEGKSVATQSETMLNLPVIITRARWSST